MRTFIRKVLLIGFDTKKLPESEKIPKGDIDKEGLLSCYGDKLQSWKSAFKRADEEANSKGRSYRNTYASLYFLSSIAVLFAAINIGLGWEHHDSWVFAIVELCSLGGIAWVYIKARKNQWHKEWLKDRSSAEYMRCVPIIAALPEEWDTTDSEEVRELLKELRGGVDENKKANLAQDCMKYAEELAKSQRNYYFHSARREKEVEKRVHWISVVLFLVTIIAVFLHLFIESGWLTVIATTVPAATAALHGFVESEESERLTSRYSALEKELKGWIEKKGQGGKKGDNQKLRDLVVLLNGEVGEWKKLLEGKSLQVG